MDKRFWAIVCVALAASFGRGESYVGAAAATTVPQGGGDLRRQTGACVRLGTYLGEFWALEGSLGVEDRQVALGVGFLGHWTGWSLYDRFFGYSAFDPFVTVGARGWLGRGRGEVGPSAGIGAFYHLDDRWSLRGDVAVTLGLDSSVEFVSSFSLGLQYAF